MGFCRVHREIKGRKRHKYRAVKTVVDGITFDSKAEAARYCQLKLDKQFKRIKGFTRQPSFILPGGHRYIPDFLVCDNTGKMWVEDVKGFETQAFKIKRDLWKETFPWLPLKIIKRGKVIEA